jgi:hypothetical protein
MFFSSLAAVTRSIIRLRRKQRTTDVFLPKNKSQKTKRGPGRFKGSCALLQNKRCFFLASACFHAGIFENSAAPMPKVTWKSASERYLKCTSRGARMS